jgi:hypothetical protein
MRGQVAGFIKSIYTGHDSIGSALQSEQVRAQTFRCVQASLNSIAVELDLMKPPIAIGYLGLERG